MKKGIRTVPFNDQILREMAISFPQGSFPTAFPNPTILLNIPDLDELRRIPGIDTDKVTQFGSKFLLLIHQAEAHYHAIAGHGTSDQPHDPNRHTAYVEISSDDERDEPGSGDDLSGGDEARIPYQSNTHASFSSPAEESSSYFDPPGTSVAVHRFNQQLEHMPTMLPGRQRSSSIQSRGRGSRGGRGRAFFHKGSVGFRKKAAGGSSARPRPSNRGRGRGGGGGGMMGMMPT